MSEIGKARGERILAVDRQPRTLESLRALVGLRALELDTAETASEALALLDEHGYGIVLVDIQLPDGDGFRIMQAVRERGLDCHVIVLTADNSAEAPVQALRRGAADFIRKPYGPDELLLTLENTLERRRLVRQNQEIQGRLKRSERLYRFIVDSSPDLIYVLDPEGRFTFVNSAAERLLGHQPESLLGRHYSHVIAEEDQTVARCCFNERRTGERATRNLEITLKRAGERWGDRPIAMDVTAMGMYADADAEQPGRFLGTYGVARDVSERKSAEAIIRYQAYHDMLTGLPNRALFKDRLRQALARARREARPLAVLFLDLDRFKVANDSLGHTVGDHLLECAARRLRSCLREADTLARLGGDEFTVLVPDADDREAAERVGHKCIEAMREPFHIDGHELVLGVSVGIALYPEHGDSMEALVKHADVAMYHVKGTERGQLAFYDTAMGNRVDHHLTVESGLRRALAEGELRVVYQPQVDVESGRITAVEALVRWHHPERGAVPPSEFIPVAEQTGLIAPISNWVLRTACREMLRWPQSDDQPLRLAVNLSAQQTQQPDFVQQVAAILEETGFPPQRLELEITEHLLMRDMDAVVDKLRQLSGMGVHFAIDDFGTGYSSLSYLQQLPIHTLKIDQSFIHGLREGRDEATLVSTIITMARGLGLKIVAEGVETEDQLRYLREMECDEMQGFLFTHPLEGREAQGWLSTWAQRQVAGACG